MVLGSMGARLVSGLQVCRRSFGAGVCGAGALVVGPAAQAGAEWRVTALIGKVWAVQKKQESSVRIRPETMLVANDEASDRELRLLKVPLGRAAATSFDEESQYDLARYFSSRSDADRLGAPRVAQGRHASRFAINARVEPRAKRVTPSKQACHSPRA